MNTNDDINSIKSPNTKISSINFTKDLFSIIYKSPTKLTLMYSDKCPFCRKIRPIWNNLRDVYENKYVFDVVDCDYEKERASKYDFRALPTIFKNDYINPISKSEGFMEYNKLEEFITKIPEKKKDDNFRIEILMSKTCPYCTKFISIINDLKKQYSISIKEIYCQEDANKCNDIRGVPTTIIYNNDIEVEKKSGFMNINNLISFLNIHVNNFDKFKIIDNTLKESNKVDKKNDSDYDSKKDINIYINPNCPYCKKFEPIWNKFKNKYSLYFNFNSINCTKSSEICRKEKIQGVPTIKIMKDNNIIDNHVGYCNENVFDNFLKKHFSKLTLSVVVSQLCDFSKEMLKYIKEYKNKYPDIINITVVDNTFENQFKLVKNINSFPSLYVHNEKKIIKSSVGVKNEDELNNWILFE